MQASPKHSPLTCQSAALPPIRHCKASATLKTHGVETAMRARSIAKEGLALTSIASTGVDGASISSKLRDLTDREQEPTLTTISRRKDRRAPYAMERLSFEMEGVGFSTAAQSILNAKGRRTLLGRAEIGGRAAATLTAVGAPARWSLSARPHPATMSLRFGSLRGWRRRATLSSPTS